MNFSDKYHQLLSNRSKKRTDNFKIKSISNHKITNMRVQNWQKQFSNQQINNSQTYQL